MTWIRHPPRADGERHARRRRSSTGSTPRRGAAGTRRRTDWIVEAETDLRVGGTWRVWFGPSRDEMYLEHGVFEEIDPPHRLVYSTLYEFPDGRPCFETRVTVTFEARGRRDAADHARHRLPERRAAGRNESGWPGFLDALRADARA